MNFTEFKIDPSKLLAVHSTKIINDIEKENTYYQIKINGGAPLNAKLPEWTMEKFLFEINEIGMMFGEVNIHIGNINAFESLDEFMLYTRLNEGDTIDQIQKSIFKKGASLGREEFIENEKLYLDEIFMNSKEKRLADVSFDKYQDGYFYYNEPAIKSMGCVLQDSYWGFSYQPYI